VPLRALLPLAALTFVVALATSRYGLVIHELMGHGGTAIALGGQVQGVHLFWFGGGWVTYLGHGWTTAEILAVTLGGIATEWIAAAVLALIARRARGLARMMLAGAATGFAIHGGMYLAVGTFYGSGDGALLHQLLGASRPLVWAPAAAVCVAAAWLGARAVVPVLRAHAPGTQPLMLIGAALVLGGAAHLALLVGEREVRPDATYTAIMKTEGQRAVERDVAAAKAAHPELTPAQIDDVQRASQQQHKPFPFTSCLIAAIAIAAIAAFLRSKPAPSPEPLAWRQIRAPALVALLGLTLVIACDFLI
jgi:hypothetical protein